MTTRFVAAIVTTSSSDPNVRVQNYSVVLVIPDFYDRAYVREFVNILLLGMGFKQICVQQVGATPKDASRFFSHFYPGVPCGHLRRWNKLRLCGGYWRCLHQRGLC